MMSPMAIQPKNTIQLLVGISIIKYIQHNTPNTGMSEKFLIKVYTVMMAASKRKIKNKYSWYDSVPMLEIASMILLLPTNTKSKNSAGTIHFPLMYGSWNFPASFGLNGKSNTPPLTSTNANKVPMLVRPVMSLSSTNSTSPPTSNPEMMVANPGVLNLG